MCMKLLCYCDLQHCHMYVLVKSYHYFSHPFNCLYLFMVQEAISQVMPNTTATAFECKTGKVADINIFFTQTVQQCQ